jgi:hypothetical protein
MVRLVPSLVLCTAALTGCHLLLPLSPPSSSSPSDGHVSDGSGSDRDGGTHPGDGALGDRPSTDDGGGAQCSPGGWCWESPLPLGNRLRGVWGSGPSDIYAVGEGGTILHYNGTAWSKVDPQVSMSPPLGQRWLNAVWGTSSTDVYVVGELWTLLHFNGTSWSVVPLGSPPQFDNALYAVWGSGPTDVFAAGDWGKVIHLEAGQWKDRSVAESVYLRAIAGTDGTAPVYVAGATWTTSTNHGVVYSWDRSGSWTAEVTESGAMRGLLARPGEVFVVGEEGTALRKSAGWTKTPLPSGYSNLSLSAVWEDGGTVYAMEDSLWDDGTTELFTYNSTNGWQHVTGTELSNELLAGWSPGSGSVLAGAGGTIVSWTGGSSFAQQMPKAVPGSPTDREMMAVWGRSGNDLFAVGVGGTIMHRGPSGWTSQLSNTTEELRAVWGSTTTNLVIAVGTNGTILHYDGSTWSKQPSPSTTILEAVWGANDTDLWIIGDDDQGNSDLPAILRFDGSKWNRDSSVPKTLAGYWLDAVWGTAPTSVFAAGGNHTLDPALGLLLHYNGASWQVVTMPTPTTGDTCCFLGMWGRSDQDMYLTTWSGYLYHYDGTNLSRVLSGPAFAGQLDFAWGEGQTMLLAGAYGQIYRLDTTSGSSSWSVLDTGCGNHLHGLWMTGKVAYAVGESGTLLRGQLP